MEERWDESELLQSTGVLITDAIGEVGNTVGRLDSEWARAELGGGVVYLFQNFS